MPKKSSLKDAVASGALQFTFEDGTVLQFVPGNCSEDIQNYLMFHGASQKIGDSYASAGGTSDPLAYAKQAAADTIKQLYDGDWRTASIGGPRITDLVVALSRITGKSIEAAQAFVESLDDDQKKATRARPQVKAMLAVITAERAAEKAKRLADGVSGDDDEGFDF